MKFAVVSNQIQTYNSQSFPDTKFPMAPNYFATNVFCRGEFILKQQDGKSCNSCNSEKDPIK